MSLIARCDYCDGRGAYSLEDPATGERRPKTCPRCKGVGEVEAVPAADYRGAVEAYAELAALAARRGCFHCDFGQESADCTCGFPMTLDAALRGR